MWCRRTCGAMALKVRPGGSQPHPVAYVRRVAYLPALLALSVGPTVAFGHHLIGCGNCAAAALPKGTASTPAAAKEARGAAMRGDARVWG